MQQLKKDSVVLWDSFPDERVPFILDGIGFCDDLRFDKICKFLVKSLLFVLNKMDYFAIIYNVPGK